MSIIKRVARGVHYKALGDMADSSMVAVKTMTCDQLKDYLILKGIDIDVAETIRANRIDGELFSGLCKDDHKEIAPVLDDRMRLGKM